MYIVNDRLSVFVPRWHITYIDNSNIIMSVTICWIDLRNHNVPESRYVLCFRTKVTCEYLLVWALFYTNLLYLTILNSDIIHFVCIVNDSWCITKRLEHEIVLLSLGMIGAWNSSVGSSQGFWHSQKEWTKNFKYRVQRRLFLNSKTETLNFLGRSQQYFLLLSISLDTLCTDP